MNGGEIRMEIRKHEDGSIELFGYVNITERNSKILKNNEGVRFREQIKKGAWSNAIKRNNDIKLLINHEFDEVYASTKDDLRLYEDNIGARFSIRTSDETLISHADKGDFKGLSFRFTCNKDRFEESRDLVKLRVIEDMNVSEVSLLTVEPAYDGCMVEMRDVDGKVLEERHYTTEFDIEKEELRNKKQETKIKLLELELEI